jgi:hypothetical protein
MWTVKDGKLYCGSEAVSVRRVVVELVAGRLSGPLSPDRARTMLRMERALSLRGLSRQLSAGAP